MNRKKSNRERDRCCQEAKGKRIVVIGSGIGGMASGTLFAQAGFPVWVLERHARLIGGHARHPRFHGLIFSMGPQYVWHFEQGEVGHRFLKFLNIQDKTPFVPMDPDGFETLFIGAGGVSKGTEFFQVPMGLERFRDQMLERFPEEKKRLEPLFSDLISIYNGFCQYTCNHELTSFAKSTLEFLLYRGIPFSVKVKLVRSALSSLETWFDQYGISELPRRILYGHSGIFLENESELSAIAFIVATGNYHAGSRYPAFGFDHFFKTMKELIEDRGGRVETGKRVVRICVEGGHATLVQCEDGSEYPCDVVISDIAPRLMNDLLPQEYRLPFEYEPSRGTIACCIGLNGTFQGVKAMRGRNYWYQDGRGEINFTKPNVAAPPRMLYVSSHTANGFGLSNTKKKDDSLVVFIAGNYDQVKTIYEQGNVAVKEFKKSLADQVVDIIDSVMFPGIKRRVRFCRVVSSLDIESEIGSEYGSVYGRRLSVSEVKKQPPANFAIDNIFNVSSTHNSPGIAAGIETAVTLFEKLAGKSV